MVEFSIARRTLLRGVVGAGAVAATSLSSAAAAGEAAGETDPNTRATFEAIVDAVIPRTPAVADRLGPEHEPGGREIGLDAYLVEYVNTLFSTGSRAGEGGHLRLAEPVAKICDGAAVELLARGDNEAPPDPTRSEFGGPFAWLARDDRLRALGLLDEKEFDTASLADAGEATSEGLAVPVFEGTAGLVPQLVVAFTQVIYYSEWQGYDDISAPPGDRGFSETVDGKRLQSWRQTDFPGVIDGAAALLGYWGTPGSSLGEGRVWKNFARDDDVGDPGRAGPRIYLEPGQFTDNDYDTSDYEEPFDTGGEPADGFEGDDDGDDGDGGDDGGDSDGGDDGEGATEVRKPDDALEAARSELDDDRFEAAMRRFFRTESGLTSRPGQRGERGERR